MEIGLATTEADLHDALSLLLERPDLTPARLAQQVGLLRRNATKYRLVLDKCVFARRGGRIIAACLPVDSRGRTCSLFLPATQHLTRSTEAMIPVIEEVARLARGRHIQFLQVIVATDAKGVPEVLGRGGFQLLARLIYLEIDVARPQRPDRQPPELTWRTYNDQTHEMFCRVVQASYEGSLDCVALNGRRHIEDILASHRDTGVFDQSSWLMGFAGEQPVGVMLLAEALDGQEWDLVYTGLSPAFRGQGYATRMLMEAVHIVREHGALRLVISVDERNTPARRLYERFGCAERYRRDAWIRMLDQEL